MKNLLTPLLLSIAVVSCSTTGTEDMASDVTSTATSRTEATVNTATAETTELLKSTKEAAKNVVDEAGMEVRGQAGSRTQGSVTDSGTQREYIKEGEEAADEMTDEMKGQSTSRTEGSTILTITQ